MIQPEATGAAKRFAENRGDQTDPDRDAWTIKRPTSTTDGQGGDLQTFGPVGTVEGNMFATGRSASEEDAGGKEVEVSNFTFTTRKDADIRKGDKLTDGNRTFEVIKIKNAGSEGAFSAICEEVQTDD
jgi:head-tail adaptor